MGCKLRSVALFVAIVLVSASKSLAQVRLTPVAVSGQPAPNTETTFRGFTDPTLNDAGQVAFRASLNGANANVDSGIWLGAPGGLQLVAREGGQAPGAQSGVTYGDFNEPNLPVVLNRSGEIAFNAPLVGPGTNFLERAIWAGPPSSLQLAARAYTQAADAPAGVQYFDLRSPNLSDQGVIGFTSAILDPTRRLEGIWTGPPAALRLVARTDDPAPGTMSQFLVFGAPRLSDGGSVTFVARQNLGAQITHDAGIWTKGPGAAPLRLLLREDAQAPGLPTGVAIDHIPPLQLQTNRGGALLVPAALAGVGVNSRNNQVLFGGGTDGIRPIARSGDAAPGAGAGVLFGDFGQPFLHDSGHLAFLASLTDAAGSHFDQSIYAGTIDDLHPVAISGQHAPGTPAGASFSVLNPAITNSPGDVAFSALLGGPGIDATNNTGIWLGDPQFDGLHLVARTGQTIDLGAGPLTISRLNLALGDASDTSLRNYVLNDAGQLRFIANFTDGSSAILIAQVPEPTSILPLLGLFIVMRRRGGRQRWCSS